MKKRMLALLLCVAMLLTNGISVAAAQQNELSVATEVVQEITEKETTTEEDNQENQEEKKEGVSEDKLTPEESETEVITEEGTNTPKAVTLDEGIDASKWTSDDFTYKSYEKLLYGCDYKRQFVIKGTVISGFSDSGKLKLEKNKNLVIPSVDDEGNLIIGVGENAFKKQGLESVTFPTGMMCEYEDTVTNGKVTKRGNFIIAESAFQGNALTAVTLPEGVIACLSNAFKDNQITKVKFPKTIWWLETGSFANNRITTLNFPTTCDFQLEMHGMTFAFNFIKSVRLPDYTEVVNNTVFSLNYSW